MKIGKIIKIIEDKKQEIRKLGVKKIGIFGSYLLDKQGSKSDIDFLVKFNSLNFDNYINLLRFLEELFDKKIDLVIEEDLKPELRYVKKEAKYVKV